VVTDVLEERISSIFWVQDHNWLHLCHTNLKYSYAILLHVQASHLCGLWTNYCCIKQWSFVYGHENPVHKKNYHNLFEVPLYILILINVYTVGGCNMRLENMSQLHECVNVICHWKWYKELTTNAIHHSSENTATVAHSLERAGRISWQQFKKNEMEEGIQQLAFSRTECGKSENLS
jgi:hypothetical protein